VFDHQGRHLVTRDAFLGTTLYQFGYDGAGRLATITDVDQQVTTIQRDPTDVNGAPTAIVAPTGQITTLTLDAAGHLWTVSNPANETTTLEYSPGTGLLRSLLEPTGRLHEFLYDGDGRLVRDTDDTVSFKALARQETASGYRVTLTTAMGRTRSHQIETLADGGERRTHTGTDGLATVVRSSASKAQTVTAPDGTVISTEVTGDPRFELQAPLVSREATTTPLGRTRLVTRSRSVVLATPHDPLDVASATETVTVNGHAFTRVFSKSANTVVSTLPTGRQVTSTLTPQGRVSRVEVPGILPVELHVYPGRPAAYVDAGVEDIDLRV
jgi:YD repeat-containing protein